MDVVFAEWALNEDDGCKPSAVSCFPIQDVGDLLFGSVDSISESALVEASLDRT